VKSLDSGLKETNEKTSSVKSADSKQEEATEKTSLVKSLGIVQGEDTEKTWSVKFVDSGMEDAIRFIPTQENMTMNRYYYYTGLWE
jgi:hypothetical protein